MKRENKTNGKPHYVGVGTVLLLVILCVGFLLLSAGDRSMDSGEIPEMLLRAFRVTGFSLSTAIVAESLSLPLCISLAMLVTMIAPEKIRRPLERLASGFSAIPAVVLGYMSLKFYVPKIASPWWAVVVTLLLMSLMEQTLDFIRINSRQSALMERAFALGANRMETAVVFVYPQVKRGYLLTAISTLVRDLSEGVAILLVLSHYEQEADTLSTAIMKAVGVTKTPGKLQWVLILVLLLFLLSELIRSLSSMLRKGGKGYEA